MPLLTKTDLNTHIYPEIIDIITRTNDDIIDKAINMGEGEAKAYMNRFDLAAMFTVDNNDQFFKGLIKDIVCWHLIKLCNPNINLELFRTAYEDAIKFFEKVMKGMVDPDGWILKTNDPNTPIDDAGNVEYSTQTKRRNNY